MTFGLEMHTVRRVTSYDDAMNMFVRAKDARTRTASGLIEDVYPLPGKERNRDCSVRMTPRGVAFRYWQTDVITWHPDGSYTYDPWTSQSTCTFFNTFCPHETYLTSKGRVLVIDRTAYAVVGKVTVKDGEPSGAVGQFRRQVVNRKAAKRVLAETRYAEYRDWYKVMKPLLGSTPQPFFHPADTLDNEENWPMMVACRFGNGRPDKVRNAIYNVFWHDVYETEIAKSLPVKYHFTLGGWGPEN